MVSELAVVEANVALFVVVKVAEKAPEDWVYPVMPERTPAVVTFNPPEEVSANVPVALPMAVLPVDEVFKFKVGAVIAAVPEERV